MLKLVPFQPPNFRKFPPPQIDWSRHAYGQPAMGKNSGWSPVNWLSTVLDEALYISICGSCRPKAQKYRVEWVKKGGDRQMGSCGILIITPWLNGVDGVNAVTSTTSPSQPFEMKRYTQPLPWMPANWHLRKLSPGSQVSSTKSKVQA